MVNEDSVVVPREATQEDLLVVHTSDYLDSLRVSKDVNLSTSKNLENFFFLLPYDKTRHCLLRVLYMYHTDLNIGHSENHLHESVNSLQDGHLWDRH